ncbi:hypothetical protein MP228_007501 [Amoeboaphelidium protococcarum]|nr:hypothetical protein MP228_007501 [Amoeboaphelidium protococcarum]
MWTQLKQLFVWMALMSPLLIVAQNQRQPTPNTNDRNGANNNQRTPSSPPPPPPPNTVDNNRRTTQDDRRVTTNQVPQPPPPPGNPASADSNRQGGSGNSNNGNGQPGGQVGTGVSSGGAPQNPPPPAVSGNGSNNAPQSGDQSASNPTAETTSTPTAREALAPSPAVQSVTSSTQSSSTELSTPTATPLPRAGHGKDFEPVIPEKNEGNSIQELYARGAFPFNAGGIAMFSAIGTFILLAIVFAVARYRQVIADKDDDDYDAELKSLPYNHHGSNLKPRYEAQYSVSPILTTSTYADHLPTPPQFRQNLPHDVLPAPPIALNRQQNRPLSAVLEVEEETVAAVPFAAQNHDMADRLYSQNSYDDKQSSIGDDDMDSVWNDFNKSYKTFGSEVVNQDKLAPEIAARNANHFSIYSTLKDERLPAVNMRSRYDNLG